MLANKLKHNRPVFVAVRGAVAWVVLMGMWFVYPYVQRPHYASNTKLEQQKKNEVLSAADEELTNDATSSSTAPVAVEGRASFDIWAPVESALK